MSPINACQMYMIFNTVINIVLFFQKDFISPQSRSLQNTGYKLSFSWLMLFPHLHFTYNTDFSSFASFVFSPINLHILSSPLDWLTHFTNKADILPIMSLI